MFYSILSPIGQYRATNTTPSKGKRRKKRKREEIKSKGKEPDLPRPPPPEISSFVVLGLNSITRSLESLSQKPEALKSGDCEKNDAGQDPQSPTSGIEKKSDVSQISQRPSPEAWDEALNITEELPSVQPRASEAKSEKSAPGQTSQCPKSGAKNGALNSTAKPVGNAAQNKKSPIAEMKAKNNDAGRVSQSPASRTKVKDLKESLVEDDCFDQHFSAIFVSRSSQPPILHAHLPHLVATASLANPEVPVTRLVQLPKGCEGRLSEALSLPRVSFIGILDGAPHSKSLVDMVRECVPEIEIPWLEEVKKSVYLPVKINTVESFVPVAKKEQKSA